MLYQLAKPMLMILATVIPLWWLLRIVYRTVASPGPYSFQRESQHSMFLAYLVCLLCITLYPIPLVRIQSHGFSQVNLVPVKRTFNELSAILHSDRKSLAFRSLQNIIGNLLLFMPLGFFLPLILSIRSFFSIFLIAALFSLGIESVQYLLRHFKIYRSVDIDDIILNTLGALIGLGIYTLISRGRESPVDLQPKADLVT